MALTDLELRDQVVVELAQLAQSPGWAAYKVRLRNLSRAKSQGSSDSVRRGEATLPQVFYAQGHVDGLELAMTDLDRYVTRLQRGETLLPDGER